MISAGQLVSGIWMGTLLIALGLLPGLLGDFSGAIRKFHGGLTPFAISLRQRMYHRKAPPETQPWLAALGAAVMAFSVLLYLSN